MRLRSVTPRIARGERRFGDTTRLDEQSVALDSDQLLCDIWSAELLTSSKMKVMQAHFTNDGSRSVNSEATVMTAERMNPIFSAVRQRSRHES